MKSLLREKLYFSGAESLYRELEALDPAFRRAAGIVELEHDIDMMIMGGQVDRYTMTLEAELDVSS